MEKRSLEILTALYSSEHQSPLPLDLLKYPPKIAKDSREGNLHTCLLCHGEANELLLCFLDSSSPLSSHSASSLPGVPLSPVFQLQNLKMPAQALSDRQFCSLGEKNYFEMDIAKELLSKFYFLGNPNYHHHHHCQIYCKNYANAHF